MPPGIQEEPVVAISDFQDGTSLAISIVRMSVRPTHPDHDFPTTTIFGVDLTRSRDLGEGDDEGEATAAEGSWSETFGTPAELAAFLRGVRAAGTILGEWSLRVPDIPISQL